MSSSPFGKHINWSSNGSGQANNSCRLAGPSGAAVGIGAPLAQAPGASEVPGSTATLASPTSLANTPLATRLSGSTLLPNRSGESISHGRKHATPRNMHTTWSNVRQQIKALRTCMHHACCPRLASCCNSLATLKRNTCLRHGFYECRSFNIVTMSLIKFQQGFQHI